jgi:hypothetical protein
MNRQGAPTAIAEALVLDMDLSESPTYGEQEGSAYKGISAAPATSRCSCSISLAMSSAASACKRDPSLTSGQAYPGSEQVGPAHRAVPSRATERRAWEGLFAHRGKPGWHSGAVFEAPALVASFDDFGMKGRWPRSRCRDRCSPTSCR